MCSRTCSNSGKMQRKEVEILDFGLKGATRDTGYSGAILQELHFLLFRYTSLRTTLESVVAYTYRIYHFGRTL
jgi:hypothetical protein